MSITRAQIARELYIKGGVVNPDGRRGFGGGADMGTVGTDGKQGGKGSNTGLSGGYQGGPKGGYGGGDGSVTGDDYRRSRQEFEDKVKADNARREKERKEKEKKEKKKKTIKKYFEDYNLNKRKKKQRSILSNLDKKIRAGFNIKNPDINLTRSIKEMEMYGDPNATYGDMVKEAVLGGSTFGNKGDLIGAQFEEYSPKEGSAKEKFNYQPDFFTPIQTNVPSGIVQGAASIGNLLGGFFSNKEPYSGKMTELADLYDKAAGLDLSKTTTSQMTKDFQPNRYAKENNLIYDPIRKTFKPKPNEGGGDNVMSEYERRLLELEKQNAALKNQQNAITNVPNSGLGGLAPRFAGSIFDFTGLADGGRAGAMDGGMMRDTTEGGIMDLETGRQMYFLGKLVKKAKRAVKKVIKSPIGKAALLYAGAGALGNLAGGSGLGGMFKGFMSPKSFISGSKLGGIFSKEGAKNILFGGKKFFGERARDFTPFSGILGTGGEFSLGKGLTLGLGLPFALDLLGVGKDDEEGPDLDDYYAKNRIDIADIRNRPFNFLAPRFAADGGLMRLGYQEGGDAEPVAKKTMPLIDMDGQEKDYRETGGFVDMGRMERADDVPARLSKNEFVFTADAVRNAGEGDIDKGAEVMYNMMKNLESGGEVSEESQGLDGAKEMFKTSQRLEEVL